jgi:transcriptional regulator with XRE-family HTH domain
MVPDRPVWQDPAVSNDMTTRFASLVRRYAAGRSISQVEKDAGLPRGSIGNYLKPSTAAVRMPSARVMERIATALEIDLREVSRAFAADLDIPLDAPAYTDDERALVDRYRRLGDTDRKLVLDFLTLLTNRIRE